MDRVESALGVARELLSQPTAPLFEELPAASVLAFARARPGLDAERDGAGNVVVRYSGEGADRSAPVVVVAHLDHPGFAVEGESGDGLASMSFRGGLGAENAVAGSPVDFFRAGVTDPIGSGELVEADGHDGRLTDARARVVHGHAAPGGFAMWGFPGFEVSDGVIWARVCDDLLGAAVVLSTLDELSRWQPPGVAVQGLFTRGEEIGFLGALEAIRRGTVPAGASVLSLECSKALPGAPLGAGVIVRVGDRRSIFDPGLSDALSRAAGQVADGDPGFRWQRRLMDGGVCEASAFCAFGFRASGIALPLGNYHNALDAGTGVGPEHVAVDDYVAGVHLLTELVCSPELLEQPAEHPPQWLAGPVARARAELG